MIGTIDVVVQTAKPDFPLSPVKSFVDSPSSIRVRNVPRRIGEWEISGVNISVTYPDATTVERACVCVGGVWVGTIEGCPTTGTSVHGFVVTADGIDESGEVVTGYVLGVGDVEIISRENDVQPGVVMYKGDTGAPGRDGDDGETPYIGDNGNWWIGDEDTGKPSRGEKGEPGEGGGAVESVNGQTGDVVLTASDIAASEGVSVAEALQSAKEVGEGARQQITDHESDENNPHATTAEQVGVRVVELVVEGDAKKLYLMLNGERTTDRVTSYAALLAMAKRGLVRLYYNAVGGTGRKALYTAHMVDDNGTPAMRFDATGTLGDKVYTRSIAVTKSGEDGIAVSIGNLTELTKKTDVPALTTTIAETESGKAADAAAVARGLAKKVSIENYQSVKFQKAGGDLEIMTDDGSAILKFSESVGDPCALMSDIPTDEEISTLAESAAVAALDATTETAIVKDDDGHMLIKAVKEDKTLGDTLYADMYRLNDTGVKDAAFNTITPAADMSLALPPKVEGHMRDFAIIFTIGEEIPTNFALPVVTFAPFGDTEIELKVNTAYRITYTEVQEDVYEVHVASKEVE